MKKFIVCTFAFLFWGFYEMSGGADFEPGAAIEARAEMAEAEAATDSPTEEEQVARADTGGMLTQVVASAAADTVAPEDVEPAKAPMPTEELTARVNDILLTKRETNSPAARALTTSAKTISTDDIGAEPARDLREVDGNVVNMRTGPGTNFSVVDQLRRGEEVEVLRSEGGWLKLRVTETNRIGWMANYLVTASAE